MPPRPTIQGDRNAEMLPESRIRLARNEIEQMIHPDNRMKPDVFQRLMKVQLGEIDKALANLAEVRQVLRVKLTG